MPGSSDRCGLLLDGRAVVLLVACSHFLERGVIIRTIFGETRRVRWKQLALARIASPKRQWRMHADRPETEAMQRGGSVKLQSLTVLGSGVAFMAGQAVLREDFDPRCACGRRARLWPRWRRRRWRGTRVAFDQGALRSGDRSTVHGVDQQVIGRGMQPRDCHFHGQARSLINVDPVDRRPHPRQPPTKRPRAPGCVRLRFPGARRAVAWNPVVRAPDGPAKESPRPRRPGRRARRGRLHRRRRRLETLGAGFTLVFALASHQ